MTTPCVLMLQHQSEAVANEVANAIYQQTLALEKKYNFYSATSWLSQQINERKVEQVTLDDETTQVLRQVRHISRLTGGVFDICVGTIKTHANLNQGRRANKVASKLKADSHYSREQLLADYNDALGLTAWSLEGNTLTFNHPMTRLDLGGVIKEYAVDKAVKIAKQNNCSGMLSFGGDLYVIGVKTNGEPYKIGIKDPFNPKQSCMSLPVTNAALTTSGAYERQETIGGKQYHHIIDTTAIAPNLQKDKQQDQKNNQNQKPNQTNPQPSNIVSATVVTDTVLVSGMLSTALMQNPNIALPPNCKVILIDADANVSARQS